MGRVYADEMGELSSALSALQRGLALDSENTELHIELASRLKEAGHYPQALNELRTSLGY